MQYYTKRMRRLRLLLCQLSHGPTGRVSIAAPRSRTPFLSLPTTRKAPVTRVTLVTLAHALAAAQVSDGAGGSALMRQDTSEAARTALLAKLPVGILARCARIALLFIFDRPSVGCLGYNKLLHRRARADSLARGSPESAHRSNFCSIRAHAGSAYHPVVAPRRMHTLNLLHESGWLLKDDCGGGGVSLQAGWRARPAAIF